MPERHTRSQAGRHSKLTPKVQEKIVSAIRAGNYAQVAAKYAGIGVSTYYNWLQRGKDEHNGIYREFLEAVKRAESEAEVRTVALIHRHMDSSWQACMTYLERKFPDRWGRTNRLQVEVRSRDALKETLAMSDAELDDLLGSADR